MIVNGIERRTIWPLTEKAGIGIIDQSMLPHRFTIVELTQLEQCAKAIKTMQVRGAPLIGAAGAYGLYLAMHADSSDAYLNYAYETLLNTRPTAVNLRWALDMVVAHLKHVPENRRCEVALDMANEIADADVKSNYKLGQYALEKFIDLYEKKQSTLNILTHCNAGWLATVDWGTALSGVFQAHRQGIPVHVWVDETRPRNQGAFLTAWELEQEGIPYTVIADNTGGHLMQHKLVDCCIVGTDRTTRNGDVCNKIGTYLKALAAYDNAIPFYVAAPSSSIDWSLEHGHAIQIEERAGKEVSAISGMYKGELVSVDLLPEGTPVKNFAFDNTPAKYITSIITERGACDASSTGLLALFPEYEELLNGQLL
jgi:methylthioribose-1-phosphate isomerase